MLPRDLLRAEGVELQGRAGPVPPPVCSSGTEHPALGLPPALGVTLGSALGTAVPGSGPPRPPSAHPEQAAGVQSFRTGPFASFFFFFLFYFIFLNLCISGLCSRGSGSCPLHPCTAGPVLLVWLRAAGETLPALPPEVCRMPEGLVPWQTWGEQEEANPIPALAPPAAGAASHGDSRVILLLQAWAELGFPSL